MRREECQGEYEWLESRGEHLRSREEKIFPKPWCWGGERGQESVWVGGVEFQRRREEGKGNWGGQGLTPACFCLLTLPMKPTVPSGQGL